MSLKGAKGEDLRKIHAEVNQLTNQRFLITTLGVTLFGAITTLLIQNVISTALTTGQPLGGLAFILSTVNCLLLFTLFLFQFFLKRMLRVLSSYLVITQSSDWEQDWKGFRKENKYFGYSKPFAFIFALLNIVALLLPLLIMLVYQLKLERVAELLVLVVVGVLAEILILGMGLCNWWDGEKAAEVQWKALKAEGV